MSKDWTGNDVSIFKNLGASSHGNADREVNDYYATDPKAVYLLLDLETFSHNIYEPACGEGHISEVLKNSGHHVYSTDLIYRGYGHGGVDFLNDSVSAGNWEGDIITNPPYKYAKEFVEKSLSIIKKGNKVAMFLKLQFLEGKNRKKFFKENPPKVVYVSSSRLECGINGKFSGTSAVAYAWFVWEKGFKGEPVIRWFN